MNTVPLRTQLAPLLRAAAPTSSAMIALADAAGVARRQTSLARAGKPVEAGATLALCASVGLDPMTGERRPPKTISSHVVWWLLSMAVYMTRLLRRLDQRAAARIAGVSASTICRLEQGKPIAVDSMIAICRFIGVPADGYTAPCFTGNDHCNTLNVQTKVAAASISKAARAP